MEKTSGFNSNTNQKLRENGGACLASIREQSYENIELVVVDNNSMDDTKKVAGSYADMVLEKGLERGAQRNYGALKASGDYLLFLDIDMVLSKDDEQNTGTEDFDLPQRIKAKYGTGATSRVNEYIYHDDQNLSLLDSCRKKYYYGKKPDRYRSVDSNRANFPKQYSILQRYKLFFQGPAKLLSEPLVGAGTLFLKFCDFASWGRGFLVVRLHAKMR